MQLVLPRPSTSFKGLLLIVPLCLILGLGSALLPKVAALVTAAIIGSVLGLMLPLPLMVTAEILLSTLVVGSVEYFAGVSQANWIPFLLALVLALRALMERYNQRAEDADHANKDGRAPNLLWVPVAVYLFAIIASSLLNLPDLAQFLVALKNYVFMWGAFAAYLSLRHFPEFVDWFWKMILLVALAQLPVVLYQRFFIASKLGNRGGSAGLSWDAVSGTFGGGLLGGHSSAMALFITVALTYAMVQWREGKWTLWRMVGLAALLIPSILLAEVKAAIVWLVLAGLMVFARQIRAKPVRFFFGILFIGALAGSIAFAYKTMYYQSEGRYVSQDELVEKQIFYFFDPDKFNVQTREMGRVASLVFWWREHDLSNPAELVLGHGIGASRGLSTVAVGEVARKYPFYIDSMSLVALLWDVGLLGGAAFVFIFIAGAWRAFRLASDAQVAPYFQEHLEVACIGLILIASGLLYNREAVDNASVQLLFLFFLALVIRGHRIRQTSTS